MCEATFGEDETPYWLQECESEQGSEWGLCGTSGCGRRGCCALRCPGDGSISNPLPSLHRLLIGGASAVVANTWEFSGACLVYHDCLWVMEHCHEGCPGATR